MNNMSRYMAGKGDIGLEVEKEFDGNTYKGWVTKYFKKEDLYHVKYEDDDEEDIDAEELQRIVTHKPPRTEAAEAQDHGASGSEPPVDRPRRMTRASGAATDLKGTQPKPTRNAKTSTGLGAGRRPATAAAAPEPQPPAQKKARSVGSKAPPSQTDPSQAAEAAPVPADAPAAEAEATAAGDEPTAATEPAGAAEPVAEAAPAAENGAGPSEPEGPPAPIQAHTTTGGEWAVFISRPAQGSQSTEHDAVEDLYKDVDILRTHPGTGGRPGPTRFNQVVYSRGFLFLAGQIVDDTSAPGMDTYYGQAKQVLYQVGQLLEASGSCIQRVLQVAVHLRNIDEGADDFNKAWLEVMDAEHLPARTTVQAHLMRPDLLVEVTATAVVSN